MRATWRPAAPPRVLRSGRYTASRGRAASAAWPGRLWQAEAISRPSPAKRRLVEAATAMLRGRAPRHGVTRPVARRSVSTAYTARNNTIVRSASSIVSAARSPDALCCRSRGPMAVWAARSGSCTFMLARVSVISFSSRPEPDLTLLPLQMLQSQSLPGTISLSSLRTCLQSSSVRIL